jgi:hypothetical protein
MKNWETRLDETIKFIGSCSAGTAIQRQTVKGYLKTWNTTNTEIFRKETSEAMSMGIKADSDETKPRKFRRALILLNTHYNQTKIKQEYLQEIYNYGEGQLPQKLEDAIEKSMLREGDMGLLAQKLNQLKTSPLTFLSNHVLSITASAKDKGEGFKFSFNPSQGGIFKLGTMSYASDQSAINCAVQIVPAQDFKAYQENIKDGINGNRIDARTNGIVVTTEFTGCSFCMQGSGSVLMAAHMNPDERRTKIKPRAVQSTCKDGKFSGQDIPDGEFMVYGRTGDLKTGYLGQDEGGGAMTIIGFFDTSPTPGWRLYSQQRMTNGKLHASKIFG